MKRIPACAAKRRQTGSVLLLVLIICLALALMLQVLTTVTLCAERAVADESTGRDRMTEKEVALAAVRQRSLTSWAPYESQVVVEGDRPVEATVEELAASDWVRQVSVRQDASVSRTVVSAWLERGRDGVDLPLAAVAASSVLVASGRETDWLQAEPAALLPSEPTPPGDAGPSGGAKATAFLRKLPAESLCGEACVFEQMAADWRLDVGWLRFIATGGPAGPADASQSPPAGAAFGPGVLALRGRNGQWLTLADELSAGGGAAGFGRTEGSPLLIIATGGASLDARDLGDIYGVMVVDEGGLRVDGTTVHGAVFVTDMLDVGTTGAVLFSRPLLRWACDRSLTRVRLVPGTRSEGTE